MKSLPIHFNGPLIIKLKMDLSDCLITKAESLAKQAKEYEDNANSEMDLNPNEQKDHLGCIVASIILSVSYLESYVSNILSEILSNSEKILPENDQVSRFVSGWNNKETKHLKGLTIARKYQYILEKLCKNKFIEEASTFKNADRLRKLRNKLVHYQPEYIQMLKFDLNTQKHLHTDEHEIEKMLKGLFPENPLVHSAKPFFPSKCLGSGCAFWGTKSARDFIDGFKIKASIEN